MTKIGKSAPAGWTLAALNAGFVYPVFIKIINAFCIKSELYQPCGDAVRDVLVGFAAHGFKGDEFPKKVTGLHRNH